MQNAKEQLSPDSDEQTSVTNVSRCEQFDEFPLKSIYNFFGYKTDCESYMMWSVTTNDFFSQFNNFIKNPNMEPYSKNL